MTESSTRLFVGRKLEMGELTGALDEMSAGRGGLFLLSGEPGAGKTRLAMEVAGAATGRGARALWGRCHEDAGAPVYWPWTQIFRACARGIDLEAVASALGPAASDLAVVAPDIARRLDSQPSDSPTDPVEARFRLFDAVAAFLAAVSESRPLLLLFDDLQWADGPSLALLQFVAREATTLPVMLLATYRSSEARIAPELAHTLGSLTRSATNVPLGGLSREETAEMVGAIGLAIDEASLEKIHATTGGNPFFVDEVARELRAGGGGDDLPIPDTVMEAIRGRLRHLPPEAVEALAVAAALGRTFQVAHLENVVGVRRGELNEVLDLAADAGVFDRPTGHFGAYSFAHDIFRDALYATIPAPHRPGIHLRFARALEASYGSRIDEHLAEVAHHFIAAGQDGALEGLGYASRAGHHAAQRMRWDEAAAHLDRAMSVLGTVPMDRASRCAFLLDLAEGLVTAGRRDRAEPPLREAAAIAAALEDWDSLIRAALALSRLWLVRTRESEARLERARALRDGAGSNESPAARAVLLADLSRELNRVGDPDARSVVEQAAAEATESGDAQALVDVLRTRLLVYDDPDEGDLRLQVIEDLMAAAERAGDAAAASEALTWKILTLLECGGVGDFKAAMNDALARTVSDQGSPAWRESAIRNIMHAVMEGRVADAERMIVAALTTPGPSGDRFDDLLVGQMFIVWMARGRLEPLVRHNARIEALDPGEARWQAWIANGLARMGRKEEARERFERAAATKFIFRRDFAWMTTVLLLADTCAILKDKRRAVTLVELLEPYRDRFGVFAPSGGLLRPVTRDLGVLYLTMGRLDDAVAALEESVERTRALGARLFGTQCKADLSRALRRRNQAGDAERAEAMLQEALADATEMGLLAGAAAVEVAPPAAAESGSDRRATLRLEGEFWTAGFGDGAFRIPNTKAVRCVHLLLANPGREFHAVEMVALLEGHAAPSRGADRRSKEAGLAADSAGLGPMLDDKAKAMFRERVEDLRAEIDEAEEWGDMERAARAKQELEAIADQLGAGIGLGGRDRTGPNDADRARVNVTRMIKRAIDAIAPHEPAMARHLTDSIRRGFFCAYEPDPAARIAWVLS